MLGDSHSEDHVIGWIDFPPKPTTRKLDDSRLDLPPFPSHLKFQKAELSQRVSLWSLPLEVQGSEISFPWALYHILK